VKSIKFFPFSCDTENIIWLNGKKDATFAESNKVMFGATGHIHSQAGQSCCVLYGTEAGFQCYVDEFRVKPLKFSWCMPNTVICPRNFRQVYPTLFMAVWQCAVIIFSVAHKWKIFPDPLKFFLCYSPSCSKSWIISSPDGSKKWLMFAKLPNPRRLRAYSAVPLSFVLDNKGSDTSSLQSGNKPLTRPKTLTSYVSFSGHKTTYRRPERRKARKKVWRVICLAKTGEIQYAVEVVWVRAPFLYIEF
jgi:hypothetical protein